MRRAVVVVDLGYGDQGKGTLTDFLVRDLSAHTVVRFNGGAQAGHNVVLDDGRHHTFAQFGAGSFVPGVETFLGDDVVLQPMAMLVEAEALARVGVGDAFERTRIGEGAPVITPFHRAVNRLREQARGDGAHGTCGMGVGETVRDHRTVGASDRVVARDLFAADLGPRLRRIQERKRAEIRALVDTLHGDVRAERELAVLEETEVIGAYLERLEAFRGRARLGGAEAVLARDGAVVFEGAQGVLLDEDVGFHPYTTWSRCTDANAAAMLDGYDGETFRLGVLRAYATRHGPGPFVTEDPTLAAHLPEPHNASDGYQGAFRVGAFDAVAARYAIRACGRIDGLAITCVDRLVAGTLRVATRYVGVPDLAPPPAHDLEARTRFTETLRAARPVYEDSVDVDAHLAVIGRETLPPALLSEGPTAADKRWLHKLQSK